MKKKTKISLAIIFGLLLLDQILKIWIKTNLAIGEFIPIFGDKIMLYFVENPGMAFGMKFGGDWGKLALSIFRIIAIGGFSYILYRSIKRNEDTLFIVCISLIIAGAAGNMIDSAFYGVLFDSSYGQVASFLPESGGYAKFLHGHVVDMFYCPIINSQFPEWFPFVGGEPFQFFRPIFNVADSAITISMFIMILFYRRIFGNSKLSKK